VKSKAILNKINMIYKALGCVVAVSTLAIFSAAISSPFRPASAAPAEAAITAETVVDYSLTMTQSTDKLSLKENSDRSLYQ
jgi:hypothetical protein